MYTRMYNICMYGYYATIYVRMYVPIKMAVHIYRFMIGSNSMLAYACLHILLIID